MQETNNKDIKDEAIEKNETVDVWKDDDRFKVIIEKIKFGNPDNYKKWLDKNKIDYVVKQTTESTHFVFEGYSTRFIHSSHFSPKFLYLFGLVKKEVQDYLEHNGAVFMPPKNQPVKYNFDYEEDAIPVVGTDINHAYWRIAYQKGFITEATYEKGLTCPSKATLQASLSVLGRKKYYTYVNQKKTSEQICTDYGNKDLRDIYQYIRLSCYNMMDDISNLLGDDFDCYKTDAIYYRGTKENIKKVHDYLDARGFTYKQLDYYEESEEEESEEE